MFTKPAEKKNNESSFEHVLSKEGLDYKVISCLSLKDGCQVSRVTHGLYQVNQNALMWRERYQKDFGPLVFDCDYREQYFAMHLWQLANDKRKDKADYYVRKLNEFIEKNKKNDKGEVKPWTAFFWEPCITSWRITLSKMRKLNIIYFMQSVRVIIAPLNL